jgi:hypothetical protein
MGCEGQDTGDVCIRCGVAEDHHIRRNQSCAQEVAHAVLLVLLVGRDAAPGRRFDSAQNEGAAIRQQLSCRGFQKLLLPLPPRYD